MRAGFLQRQHALRRGRPALRDHESPWRDRRGDLSTDATSTITFNILPAGAIGGIILPLPIPLTGTIQLESALDTIAKNVTIQGSGENSLTVARDTAQGQFRIFSIAANIVTTINDLTACEGSAVLGGAMLNAGNLTLNRVALFDNTATSGGAIADLIGGSVNLTQVDIHSNTATGSGAGIFNLGSLVTLNSSIFSNVSQLSGGGIYNGDSGVLNLFTTDIFGNAAALGGGFNNVGTMVEFGGQLSGNMASISGAGLYSNSTGVNWLLNVSITGNGAIVSGGGIYIGSGNVSLVNCTVSGNTAPAGQGAGIAYKLGASYSDILCTITDPADQV